MTTAFAFDQTRLRAVLNTLIPAPLKGLDLIGGAVPVMDRTAVREAVLELIHYTNGCARAIEQLHSVPAVPLTTFVCVEWAL